MKTLLLLLTFSISIQAQDFKYATFNIISSGVIGGIGSGVHKHKGQNFGQAFIKGFWKGCIGGSISVTSKQILSSQLNNDRLNWRICWVSKIGNSFSNTILYNATMNNDNIVANYSINIGFLRFGINRVQIDPISFICTGYTICSGGKFNLVNTIKTGTPIFDYDLGVDSYYLNIKKLKNNKQLLDKISQEEREKILSLPDNLKQFDARHLGEILGQNVLLQKGYYSNKVMIHELIHTYQRLEYTNINNLLFIYNSHENTKLIHNDLSIFDAMYYIQNKTIGYKNNYFEKESDFYGKL